MRFAVVDTAAREGSAVTKTSSSEPAHSGSESSAEHELVRPASAQAQHSAMYFRLWIIAVQLFTDINGGIIYHGQVDNLVLADSVLPLVYYC